MKWPMVKLKSATSKVGSGATPRGGEEVYQESGVPLIRSMNVHFDGFRRKGLVFISDNAATELDNVTVQADDVLFNITGASIGRVTTAPAEMSGARVNQHVCILRTTEVLLPRFLAFFMATPSQQALVTSNQVGGTRQAVTKALLLNWSIPLPPRSEQRRIVELLEQADGLRGQRAEADQLADRILPALFCRFFGEPTANPKHWPTSPLHKLADFVSGGTPSKEIAEFWGGTIPWVSPKDMKMAELHDAIDHVSDKALSDTNLKLIPSNTVLIVVRGMILAHTVPVCLARVPVTINQDMKALSVKGDATAEFLQWALLTQHRVLLRLVTTAAHGTRKLDTAALGALEIPIPPADRNDLIEKWTAIVREQQAAARKRADCGEAVERIWRVMLHRAFTGELTAQWREAHLKELLAEMEQQARLLRAGSEHESGGTHG